MPPTRGPIRGTHTEMQQLIAPAHSNPTLPTTDEVQPPRPPNAWILYRSKMLQTIPPETRNGVTMAEVSKLIGKWWRAEPPEVREQYAQEAERRKAEHKLKYPNYKFKPQKKEDRVRSTTKKATSRNGSTGTNVRVVPYTIPSAPMVIPVPLQDQQIWMAHYLQQQSQFHELYGLAGPSPPMDAFEPDEPPITPLSLSEPDLPALTNGPSPSSSEASALVPYPTPPDIPLLPQVPEISPTDVCTPSTDSWAWPSPTEFLNYTIDDSIVPNWESDLQSMFANDPSVYRLDNMAPPPPDVSFDIDFGNLTAPESNLNDLFNPSLGVNSIVQPLGDGHNNTTYAYESFFAQDVPSCQESQPPLHFASCTPVSGFTNDTPLQPQNQSVLVTQGSNVATPIKYHHPLSGPSQPVARRVGGPLRLSRS